MEPIGAGGMGAVFKAYDKKLHRIVALKLLPSEYLSQQDRRRRFFQEARAAALNHPHILTVYEVGERGWQTLHRDGIRRGRDVATKDRVSLFENQNTLDIAIQISEGLQSA